jgi:hypothetical protein
MTSDCIPHQSLLRSAPTAAKLTSSSTPDASAGGLVALGTAPASALGTALAMSEMERGKLPCMSSRTALALYQISTAEAVR